MITQFSFSVEEMHKIAETTNFETIYDIMIKDELIEFILPKVFETIPITDFTLKLVNKYRCIAEYYSDFKQELIENKEIVLNFFNYNISIISRIDELDLIINDNNKTDDELLNALKEQELLDNIVKEKIRLIKMDHGLFLIIGTYFAMCINIFKKIFEEVEITQKSSYLNNFPK